MRSGVSANLIGAGVSDTKEGQDPPARLPETECRDCDVAPDHDSHEQTTHIEASLNGDEASDRPIPDSIGRYRILRKLGEGGMGVVFEAEQQNPRRRVALKVVRSGKFVDDMMLRMFQREVDSLARLKHPNIGGIFESGRTEDGQHFFAMELVDGETLDAYLQSRQELGGAPGSESMSAGELRFRLALLRKLSDAIHYAHQRGVIHRDLKPSNILVTEEAARGAEVVSTGSDASFEQLPEVKILDFGLARMTEEDVRGTRVTQVGAIKGTLPYMSPEQARGDPDAIDLRSDVYALGVILYEMLSGTRPYDVEGKSLVDALRTICEEVPRPLRQACSGRVPADVETIVAKTLEKDADRRYASAAELSAEIGRFLTQQPILARPPSAVYQLRKFAARNRVLVAGVLATFLALLIGVVASTVLGVREARQRREATWNGYVANIVAAESSLRLGEIEESRRRLAACPPSLRGWEWRYLSRRVDRSSMILEGHARAIESVAVSPDGTLIVSGAADGTVRLWSRETGEQRARFRAPRGAGSVAFSTDGSRIVVGQYDGTVRLWHVETQESLGILEGHESSIQSARFSPDGSRIVSGSWDKTVRLWDAASGELLTTIQHSDKVYSVAYSPDGALIAYGSEDKTVRFIDAVTGRPIETFEGHESGVNAIAFSVDGRLLAASSFDGTIRVWNGQTATLLKTLDAGEGNFVSGIAFDPGGDRIVSGTHDGRVRLWSIKSGEVLDELLGHEGFVNDVAFALDGTWVVSGSTDGTVRVWNPAPEILAGHTSQVLSVAFDSDGTRIASSSFDKTVKVWDVRSGELVSTLKGHRYAVLSVSYCSDGATVVSGSVDKTVRIWDLTSATDATVLQGHESAVSAVTCSPETGRIASASRDGEVRLWERSPGVVPMVLDGHEDAVEAVAFDPTGKRIVSGGRDGELRVWDAATGALLMRVEAHEGNIRSVAYSPDGRFIVSGSDDRTVGLWSASSGRESGRLTAHEGEVWSVAFSPDGSRIASGSGDATIRVWDTTTRELVTTLVGHEGRVQSVRFSPDGSRIASASQDRSVRLW
jgi:WD40 repeat protein/serine/threonine protein kinase